MKTIASDFVEQAAKCGRDARTGFRVDGWQDIANAARAAALEIKYPHGGNSYDATVELRLADDSKLIINNPRQAAFAGYMQEV